MHFYQFLYFKIHHSFGDSCHGPRVREGGFVYSLKPGELSIVLYIHE